MSGNTHAPHTNQPASYEKTVKLPDVLEMFVAKKIYQGWLDVSLNRELNTAASDFKVSLVDVWETNKEPWRLAPGEAIHMHAGGKSILTGYIDKIEAAVSAAQRQITCSGRTKTCDLVDCSILGDENQFKGMSLKAIVLQLVKPFGLAVSFQGDEGASFADIKVSPGETVFSLIDKLARQRKLVVYPSVDGSLVFANPGARLAATELVQGINVKSGNVTSDFTDRYSIYKTKANANNLAWLKDDSVGKAAPSGEATDDAVGRYRPLMLVGEVTGDDEVVEDRAAYESSLRAAQSLHAEVVVQGWFQAPGRLWEINEIVKVDIGFLGLKRKMLIEKIEFSKSESGTTATLRLILPEALDYKVKKKKAKAGPELSWIETLDRKEDYSDGGRSARIR
jgi:prophage tail gpP-like protein